MRSEIACESRKCNVIYAVFAFAFKNSYFAKNEDPIRKLVCSIDHSACSSALKSVAEVFNILST